MVSIVHHCIRRRLLSCSPCFPLCLAADNDSKRLTDHSDADGCRPALNIDVMRVIAVCKTAAQLKKAVQKLGKTFKGCGRVKVRTAAALNCASISSSAFAHAGAPSAFPSLLFSLPRNAVCCCCCRRCCIQNNFKLADAAFMFHLRTFVCNFVFDFDVTFGKLKDRPGVMRKWTDHVERSDPAGGAPRERWRAEAREALSILTGGEFANKAVVFICEAQMLLDDVYQVRKEMHEASDDAACCASRLLARCSRSHRPPSSLPSPLALRPTSPTRATAPTAARSCTRTW